MTTLPQHDARAVPPKNRLDALTVALLTGGGDPHYAYGLSTSLAAQGVAIDLIGSDEFEGPAFRNNPSIRVLNLRGSVNPKVGAKKKIARILKYYLRLLRYAATAKPRIFHILWNNKFEGFDRTLLLMYYRMLGKKIVLTAHNVNTARRDKSDSWFNRLTLRIQYRLCSCIFAHTEKMKQEIVEEFGVPSARVCLIPYGINNAVPDSALTPAQARQKLGIGPEEKVLLFFGRINPYKGVEYLLSAFEPLRARPDRYRLIVAGRPDDENYGRSLFQQMQNDVDHGRILLVPGHVPDEAIEIYFKAADALALPYRDIYQSGILFLGQSFGLPVLASDVGSFREEIVEGKTGFIFQPANPADLMRAIDAYFASDLYASLNLRRSEIRSDAIERHSWDKVSRLTVDRYADLVGRSKPEMGAMRSAEN